MTAITSEICKDIIHLLFCDDLSFPLPSAYIYLKLGCEISPHPRSMSLGLDNFDWIIGTNIRHLILEYLNFFFRRINEILSWSRRLMRSDRIRWIQESEEELSVTELQDIVARGTDVCQLLIRDGSMSPLSSIRRLSVKR